SWCSDCGEGLKHIPERCGIVDRCDKCAKRFYSRVRKRALRAFGHAWNRRKKSSKYVILITLTVRHSGDVRADRRAIQAEWPRFRAWLHHRAGAPPYFFAWECTNGEDGKGHVHAHIVTIWPWVDWDDAISEWKNLTRGRGSIHFSTKNPKSKRHYSVQDAAHYCAKYATKGSSRLMAPIGAAWHASSWSTRRYTTSLRFLEPLRHKTACCGASWSVRILPHALREPGAACLECEPCGSRYGPETLSRHGNAPRAETWYGKREEDGAVPPEMGWDSILGSLG